MSARISAGQTWFVVLPGSVVASCALIDEVTRKTVALRQEIDLGSGDPTAPAMRYVRDDVRFVERIP